MAKIIKLDDQMVSIGMEDGRLRVLDRAALNFEPQLGDEVDLFEGDGQVVVTRREPKQPKNIQREEYCNKKKEGPEPPPAGAKKVNQLVYCLLAFLLGDFGAQEFYIGNIGAGIACAIFFWTGIPAIVGIVKGIIALSKDADQNGDIYL